MPKLHFLACLQLSQKARSMEDKGLVVSRFQGIARAGGGWGLKVWVSWACAEASSCRS